jgi:hypothetical protein
MEWKNTVIYGEEANKAMDFICEIKEGKYTAKKPDLIQITYERIYIPKEDAANVLNDCIDEIILYGVSN